MKIKAADERPGFAGYQFGVNDDEEEIKTEQTTLEDLPADRRRRQGEVHRHARQAAGHLAPARSADHRAARRVRRPRGRAQPDAADRADRDHDRRQAAVLRQVARRGRERRLRRDRASRRTASSSPASGLRYELLKIERRYQYYRRDGRWEYEPVKSTRRIADGRIDVAADRPGRIALPVTWGRYRLDVASDDRSIPPTSVTFDAGFYADASADTPDLLEIALDKSEYAAGDTMTRRGHGAHRRQGHAQRRRRPAARDHDDRRAGRHRENPAHGRHATGARAPMWWRRCAVRSTRRRAACRAAPSACNGSRSTRRRARSPSRCRCRA